MGGIHVYTPGLIDTAVPVGVIAIVVVVAVVDIVRSELPARHKVGWLLAAVLLPVVGLLAWFAVGRWSVGSRGHAPV